MTDFSKATPRPCDCDRCYCGNIGDAQAVAAWDAEHAQNAERDALLAEVARLKGLVQCLLDNDPDDLAADGGITVLDVWRQEARAALEPHHD